MKEIQSYDSFERVLKDSSIPLINTETIKLRVHEYAHTDTKRSLSRRLILILVSIIVISLGTAAFGDVVNNILFNKKGEKVFEYMSSDRILSEENPASSAESQKYQHLKDEVSKSVRIGEAGFLIITSEYKIDGSWSMFQDGTTFKNIADMMNSTTTKFKIPVSNEIDFKEGNMSFRPASESSNEDTNKKVDRKYAEALDKKLDYITWTEPLGKTADFIELNYTLNKPYIHGQYTIKSSSLNIYISRSHGIAAKNYDSAKVSKIKIGDSEGLYIDEKNPKIIIVDDSTGENLTYQFSFADSGLKDSVVSLIESMK